ncbi:MAG: hypothetical protein ACOYOS_23605 [Syntrophales bacterium]
MVSHNLTAGHDATRGIGKMIALPLPYFEFFCKKPCPAAEQIKETSEAETEKGASSKGIFIE